MDQTQLISEINQLRKDKHAIIMAHYYQPEAVQQIADFIGDSLALAQQARKTDAEIIVLCGVHFMGETAKIICPDKKVLIPDMAAGCSLADSCKAEDLRKFKAEHPGYKVISYVNTSAEVKALTDICVTSSNAEKIIRMLPKDEKIIFGPDYNLGSYINKVTGREMLLWNGACHVHEKFSVEALIQLKKTHPEAKVLAHPECKGSLLVLADVVGSTQALLNYAIQSDAKEYIVATEAGILFEMQKACPDKTFIPLPPETTEGVGCSCNECNYMRLSSLEKIYNVLKNETNEIFVDKEIASQALGCIDRMLEMSK
ncbi:MAG: quinolinate synthase NadA [Paludibacteraceae bacterium]|nr:quinolinate synthase NadA [Bacteroidales bacterium]